MVQASDIEKALEQVLPVEMLEQIKSLAQFITNEINHSVNTPDLTQYNKQHEAITDESLQNALSFLSGKTIHTPTTTLTFGTGNQVGDVKIRDVAGRDIVNLHIYLELPVDKQIITNYRSTNQKAHSFVKQLRSRLILILIGVTFIVLITLGVAKSIIRPAPTQIAQQVNEPQWLALLHHYPMVPGIGLAGVELGNMEGEIVKTLGKPDSVSEAHEDIERHIIVFEPDENTEIAQYSLVYKTQEIYLIVATNRDSRKARRIRIINTNIREKGIFPSYKGVSIGSTPLQIKRSLGSPINEIDDYADCYYFSNSESTIYEYNGISFTVCKADNRVHMIDIDNIK